MKEINFTIGKYKEFDQKEFLQRLRNSGYTDSKLDVESLFNWAIMKYKFYIITYHTRLYIKTDSIKLIFLYNYECMNPNFYYIILNTIIKEFENGDN